MKRFSSSAVVASVIALSLPVAAPAQVTAVAATAKAPGERMAAAEVEIRARVVEIDKVRRTATLLGPKGKIVTVDVPPSVKNFDQVRVGDELVVRHLAAVALKLEPAPKSGIRERVETTSTSSAAPGALPGAAEERTVEVLGTIQALDRKARTATLRGTSRSVTLNVPEGVDMTKVKVGDYVLASFTEATVISVERAQKAK
jgi:hypothetical protein